MRTIRLIAILSVLLPATQLATAEDSAAGDAYTQLLARQGIAADVPSLRKYLSSIADKADDAALKRLIEDLGDEDFFVRQSATRQLQLVPVPKSILQRASHSADPQVKWRAQMLMRRHERNAQNPQRALHAALRVIADRQDKGFTELLLQLAPHCTESFLEDALVAALAATITGSDKQRLEDALHDDSAARRRIAVLAVSRIDGRDAGKKLRALIASEKNERVLLAAAGALAQAGDAACLPPLAKLLRSGDEAIRAASARLLRLLTGQEFGFDAATPQQQRARAAIAWTDWTKTHGATFKLRPLPTPARVVLCLENGTYIGLDSRQAVAWKIEELRKWQFSRINSPSGCVRLPNGNLLISSRSMGIIVEATPAGEFVRELSVGGAGSLQRLDNGNLLVSLGARKQVVEVTSEGKPVWQAKVRELAGQALRLADGNTLVAVHNLEGLIELNAAGAMVREWEGVPVPASIRELPGGNLLLTSYQGDVVQYTRDGRPVSTIKGQRGVRDAVLLASGNYLLALPTGVREITPAGKTVWENKVGRVNRLLVEP